MPKTLSFKDKQLLVKTKSTLFGEATEKTGDTVEVEVVVVGDDCTRYKVGDTILVYQNALMKINSGHFKEDEKLIESETVGRGVICQIKDAE